MPLPEGAWDLIVVGAGPAGSAAAIAALRKKPGARVLILDRSPLGRDKVCGDGIAPHAIAELDALGVTVVARPEELVATRAPGRSVGWRRRGADDESRVCDPAGAVRRAPVAGCD